MGGITVEKVVVMVDFKKGYFNASAQANIPGRFTAEIVTGPDDIFEGGHQFYGDGRTVEEAFSTISNQLKKFGNYEVVKSKRSL
jgi:hypothetical protein